MIKHQKLSTLIVLCKATDVHEKLYKEATDRYEADIENEELEAAADEAYKAYHNSCRNLSQTICEITAGKVDQPTALKMAFEKRSEIENIFQYK